MAGSSARSFQVGMDEADLNLCRAAGVDPAELVHESVRVALAALTPLGDEGEPGEEEEPEAEEVAEEETESVEAPSYPR